MLLHRQDKLIDLISIKKYPIYLLKIEDLGYFIRDYDYILKEDPSQDITTIESKKELIEFIQKTFVVHPFIYKSIMAKTPSQLVSYNTIEETLIDLINNTVNRIPILSCIIIHIDFEIHLNNFYSNLHITVEDLEELRKLDLISKYPSESNTFIKNLENYFYSDGSSKQTPEFRDLLNYSNLGNNIVWDPKKGEKKYKAREAYKLKPPKELYPTQKIKNAFYSLNTRINNVLRYMINGSVEDYSRANANWSRLSNYLKLLKVCTDNKNIFNDILDELEIIYTYHKLFYKKEIYLWEKKNGKLDYPQPGSHINDKLRKLLEGRQDNEFLLKNIPEIKKMLKTYKKKLPKCL